MFGDAPSFGGFDVDARHLADVAIARAGDLHSTWPHHDVRRLGGRTRPVRLCRPRVAATVSHRSCVTRPVGRGRGSAVGTLSATTLPATGPVPTAGPGRQQISDLVLAPSRSEQRAGRRWVWLSESTHRWPRVSIDLVPASARSGAEICGQPSPGLTRQASRPGGTGGPSRRCDRWPTSG
jgi:hypothetical protein